MPAHRILLASASPRRRQLLRLLVVPYQVCSTDIDETPLADESAEEMVARLSRQKAEAALADNRDAIVIACDTTVELEGRIYGKPEDAADARRMLIELRGREHHVHGGITIAAPEWEETLAVCTRVWMRNYADDEIDAYIASGDPMDKAASYAVQHPLFHPVDRMEGCFANVMGLALCRLYESLARHVPMPQPQIACAMHPESHCSVARLVAEGRVVGN